MSINVKHISSLILIAGMSGSGKSSVIHSLSDLGYYVIDNLPVALFNAFLDYSATTPEKFKRTALLLDINQLAIDDNFISIIREIRKENNNIELLYLDCSTETIIKRYSETRRPHPAFNAETDRGLKDTIERERNFLMPLKEVATKIIDTSNLTIHDLRRKIKEFVDCIGGFTTACLRINVFSFGFKKGIPKDCDIIMDVRFLPNPYFIPELREKSGLDKEVREYVEEQPATKEFINKFYELLQILLPQYIYEGKSYLSIGIGCTGGQHRSVAIAEILAEKLKNGCKDYLVSVQHSERKNFSTSS